MKTLLHYAIDAALEAGKAIMEVYAQRFEVYTKDDDSPVTQADLRASNIIKEMLDEEVSAEMQPLKARVEALVAQYEEALALVKEAGNQEMQDFLARRLYEMTGDIVMSLLILLDASRAPELFAKSAQVYVRHAEADCAGHFAFVKNYKADDLDAYRQE